MRPPDLVSEVDLGWFVRESQKSTGLAALGEPIEVPLRYGATFRME